MKHLNSVLVLFGLAAPLTVWAHPAHGNTVMHAVIHLLESNGIWLTLLCAVALLALGLRVKKPHLISRTKRGRKTPGVGS